MADDSENMLSGNLFFLTGALSRKLNRQADEVLASVGLSTSHALLLLLIREEPGIQPGSLAEKMYLKPSTISRLVQKLERRKLVERESEGRTTAVACTAQGKELVQQVGERWELLLKGVREELGDRYAEVLSEMISNALETIDS